MSFQMMAKLADRAHKITYALIHLLVALLLLLFVKAIAFGLFFFQLGKAIVRLGEAPVCGFPNRRGFFAHVAPQLAILFVIFARLFNVAGHYVFEPFNSFVGCQRELLAG